MGVLLSRVVVERGPQVWPAQLRRALGVLAALFLASFSHAQGWVPQRHVELVVPGGAGGSLDNTARTILKLLNDRKLLPVSSSVVNRPGAGQLLGYSQVVKHQGDPHCIGLAAVTLLGGHIVGRNPITYTDVTPIAFLMTEYMVFLVPPESPIKTGKDLIEVLKKKPDSLSVGMGAERGGAYHVALGLPLQAAGVNIKPIKMVFFPGGSQVTQVLGSHVDVAIGSVTGSLPHVARGALRAIAVSAPTRIPGDLAAVPTWEELGYKGAFGSWRSIIGPKGITPAQIAYWEGVLRQVVESEEYRQFAEKNYWDSTFAGAAETRKFMEIEYARLKSVISYLGLI